MNFAAHALGAIPVNLTALGAILQRFFVHFPGISFNSPLILAQVLVKNGRLPGVLVWKRPQVVAICSKNDEFCIKNDAFCI